MKTASRLLVLVALTSLLAGCGSSGPPRFMPKGKLTLNGEPYLAIKGDYIRMILMPAGEMNDPEDGVRVGKYNPADGTFQIIGGKGKGVLAGKYHVSVTVVRFKDDLVTTHFDFDIKSDKDEVVHEVGPIPDKKS